MLNLQAGGYWETIRARMVQAERHARGCADFAYCLKHARSMPHFSWRTVALCLKVGPCTGWALHPAERSIAVGSLLEMQQWISEGLSSTD